MVIIAIFIIVGFIFLARLFYIQVIDESYILSAESNVLRKNTIYPNRGVIFDRNGMLLKDNPRIKVEIAGHSDSAGSAKANQSISVKRAESAKKYIQDKYNIPADRMVVKGQGDSKPIADNKTNEGRAKNRRVEFMIVK